MSQKWADAATENCIWLLQVRNLPSSCFKEIEQEGDIEMADFDSWKEPEFEVDNESFTEDQCWDTCAVFLTRLEAFQAGARRVYNYGQYGKDWRIFGVPAIGELVEKLSDAGINQTYIDEKVKEYKVDRAEWEKLDTRLINK